MAQVAPGEHELRRVIDEDREVDGLGEQELLDLYRSMVLLRMYDERSVVYHRQGRIGTYAIFWNHEAMQAGAVHALDDEDWIFPSYRESAIGLLRVAIEPFRYRQPDWQHQIEALVAQAETVMEHRHAAA